MTMRRKERCNRTTEDVMAIYQNGATHDNHMRYSSSNVVTHRPIEMVALIMAEMPVNGCVIEGREKKNGVK